MGLRLSHTTFDALDPYGLAQFWRQMLDWQVQEEDSYKPGSDECYLVSPDGYTVLFMRTPNLKKVKNRVHMDTVPTGDATRDNEYERALRLGATLVADRREDLGWVVMADPEGNEFCILEG